MNILELFAPIRTFVFDVDGVLTDGNLLLAEDGSMLRALNIKDGYAVQLAVKKGYGVWVMSGSVSEPVRKRFNSLGIADVYTDVESKMELLHELVISKKTDFTTILYMGDDIPDLEAMRLTGLPCCPSDAVPEIKQVAKYISPFPGGKGCVRDVIEKVLKLNGDWDMQA